MHPAYSVIVFTTVSGAGYGLLIWLCLFGGFNLVAAKGYFALSGFGLALGMITMGLLSSTLHLGHPERAWRALSQWRSSWLSREGVAAIFTYIPAVVFAIACIFLETEPSAWWVIALLTVAASIFTVYCTGMIYASLRTVRQWHHNLVPVIYIALALTTGALIFNWLLFVFDRNLVSGVWLAIVLLCLSFGLKKLYWKSIDGKKPIYTAGSAIGFSGAVVNPLDPPHSQPNYVMREMGFTVARKHVVRLRLLSNILGFVLPIVMLLLMLFLGRIAGLFVVSLATFSAAVGVAIERWLFFAEAEHVSQLYYGAQSA